MWLVNSAGVVPAASEPSATRRFAISGERAPYQDAALPVEARVKDLLARMTLDEKIGQLRLISIGSDMPQPQLRKELEAGRVGGTFNSVTPSENRPLQESAVKSRLGIPIFFAYDIVHGHRTIFPISLGVASTWDMGAVERQRPRRLQLPPSGQELALVNAAQHAHPGDPALDLAAALETAGHRSRSSAHSACSRSRSSSLSVQRSTAGTSAASPELPAAISALRRR